MLSQSFQLYLEIERMEMSVGMRSATSSKGIRGAIFGNMKDDAARLRR